MKAAVFAAATAFLVSSCATAPSGSDGSGPAAVNEAVGASTAADSLIYKIQPGDKLYISVYNEEELQKDIVVRPDGGITFPLIGDVDAKGKSISELRQEITARLGQYIPDATVSVSLKEVIGNKIFVLGQVKNPGEYVLTGDIDVLQALSMAGGLTAFANSNKIKVLRRNKATSAKEVIPFSYKRVMRGEDLDQNITLRSGDTVIVP
jgi:polysaccharide export outer membrane protein